MNISEIINLPNHVSIPLLFHLVKDENKSRIRKEIDGNKIYIDFCFLAHEEYVSINKVDSDHMISLSFELIYSEKFHPTIHESVFGGSIQYSIYKEVYRWNILI